jgi:hypothetical protein
MNKKVIIASIVKEGQGPSSKLIDTRRYAMREYNHAKKEAPDAPP